MKRAVLFAMGALLLGMCLSACDDGGGGSGMSEEEWFAEVKLGMTMAEIEAVVGRPADFSSYSYSGNRKWLVYYWRFGDAVGTASFGADEKAASVGYSPNWYG